MYRVTVNEDGRVFVGEQTFQVSTADTKLIFELYAQKKGIPDRLLKAVEVDLRADTAPDVLSVEDLGERCTILVPGLDDALNRQTVHHYLLVKSALERAEAAGVSLAIHDADREHDIRIYSSDLKVYTDD